MIMYKGSIFSFIALAHFIKSIKWLIGHVNNIPTMQFFDPWNFQKYSKLHVYMLSLIECVWDDQNDALWDTHQHAQFVAEIHHPRNI